jgi:hypothetical protein
MRHNRNPAAIGNRSYQHQIANSLVCSLGMDGAIDACSRNGWTGTLSIILKDERYSRTTR